MNWSLFLYILLPCYLLLFCLLLIPNRRGKCKRIVAVLKKYPNLRPSHRNKIANMIQEVNTIFTFKDVVNYSDMHRIVKKMKAEKKYEKYKTHLEIIEDSINPSLVPLSGSRYDKNNTSIVYSIIGIVLTIIGIVLTIIFR